MYSTWQLILDRCQNNHSRKAGAMMLGAYNILYTEYITTATVMRISNIYRV